MKKTIPHSVSAAILLLWAGCAPQAPEAAPLQIWNGEPAASGSVNAADDGQIEEPAPPDMAASSQISISAAAFVTNADETLAQLSGEMPVDLGSELEPPSTANPSEAPPPLDVSEAVDLVAAALGEYLEVLDPLRQVMGSGASFDAMPATGLTGDCPAIAYVATPDSEAWALAIDYEFHPNRDANDPSTPCVSPFDSSGSISGVVGILRARDSATARIVAEDYTLHGNSILLSGDVEATGAAGDEVELTGRMFAEFHTRRFMGEQVLRLNSDGAVQLAGSATFVGGAHTFELSFLNVGSNPLNAASTIPSAGGVALTLETGEQVTFLFNAATPESGAVSVIVNNQPASVHVVADWQVES